MKRLLAIIGILAIITGLTLTARADIYDQNRPITATDITDTGLTASKPVFTDANKTLTSTGTVPVDQGGTGRATSTTAYGLIAAGTTATGAHQTVAAGATTEILVGGGAAALPVWTTATGTGAPVRATSPNLVTPTMTTTPIVVATSGVLSAAQVTGTLLNNYGMTLDNTQTLPAIFANAGFDFIAGATVAKYFRIDPNASDIICLDKVCGLAGKYIGWASIAEGDAVSCRAVQTGAAAYKWYCYTVAGALTAE